MVVAIVAALAAGACFAAAGVLQQRVASTRPEGESLSPGLLKELARQRLWLAGIGLAVLSYGFQSLALAFGPLTLVQPLIVSELVFAIPISARLYGIHLGAREWFGAGAVAAGLAVAVVSASPGGGDPMAPLSEWVWALAGAGAIVGVALLASRSAKGPVRASLTALAGATVMGLQSALLAVTIEHLQMGVVPLFTAWQTYLLVVASIGGLLLIQSAYQAGPLAASMPVIDATEPVVAIAAGLVLFGETLAEPVWRKGVAALAMAVVFIGIVLLDTSPVTKRLHEEESEQAEETEAGEESEQVGLRPS